MKGRLGNKHADAKGKHKKEVGKNDKDKNIVDE